MRKPSAQRERAQVRVRRHPVELDRLLHRSPMHRNRALLPRITEQQHVGQDRVAQQLLRQRGNVDELGTRPQRFGQAMLEIRFIGRPVRLPCKVAGGNDLGTDEGAGRSRTQPRQGVRPRGHDQVASQQDIGLCGTDARGVQQRRVRGDPDMRADRAVLLRQPGDIQRAAGLAVEVRRHRQDGADGHDAGTADARHQERHRFEVAGNGGIRQCGNLQACLRAALRLARPGPMQRHKARAKAAHARQVLVARRLVDLALAAQRRLQRLDGQAAGLIAAIAAPLADLRVDVGADLRVRQLAALAQPPSFGSAGLVVDQHRQPRILAQFALDGLQHGPVVHRHAQRGPAPPVVSRDIVGDHHDLPGAFRAQLGHRFVDTQLAVHGLPARHGDKAVEQQLVGHPQIGRERLADRQIAGMKVSAVTHIGEDMGLAGERRLPHPHHALAAHMRDGMGLAGVVQHRDGMAADARQGPAAIQHPGRRIVRTTGAEARAAQWRRGPLRARHRHVRRRHVQAQQALDGFGNLQHAQLVADRQHRGAPRCRPFRRALEFSAHHGWPLQARIEENGLQLRFKQRPLFLDHQDGVEAMREGAHDLVFERPHHADLQHPQCRAVRADGVDAKALQRLHRVGV